MHGLRNASDSRERSFAFFIRPTDRRSFLKWSGAAAATFAIVACDDDEVTALPPPGGVNLGTGDIGVLNYALALEQLEAAFYIQVAQSFPPDFSDTDRRLFTDLRDHEVAHREFFRAALGQDAIGELEVDFSTIDLESRASVLTAAQTLEDTGVSAYNGAAQLLENPEFLALAGKIVSVEARHASAIREINNPDEPRAFASVADEQGLDLVAAPSDVLAAVDPFIVTEIDASGLPTA